jgi:glycolate oxidase iron-sulfur subunit
MATTLKPEQLSEVVGTSLADAACTTMSPLAERMKLTLDYKELMNCMRCGFCQPACPTFIETGLEAASPRGRIALMKAVVDGVMEPDDRFRAQMDLCLGCRACEPVCPSDVKYGRLIEQTRDAIERDEPHPWWIRAIRKLMFRIVFPRQDRMRLLGGALKLYQKSGLQTLLRTTKLLHILPQHLRTMEAIVPEADAQGVVAKIGEHHKPRNGAAIAKVGLFRGCMMDVMFTKTNINTVKLLTEAGFEVVIPDTQHCCGALHAHSGETATAKELAIGNIRAFREAGVDYIASNAGGCGALLVEYDHLLHDDDLHRDDAAWFASRVKDVSALVVEKGQVPAFRDPGGASTTVTYQDSCHLRNVMRAGDAPRNLMKRVEGARFVELPESDKCCGSAGIYNIVQPVMANQILKGKMEQVSRTDARIILTSNPGCLLQMKLGIETEGLGDRVDAMHIVDFLVERIEAK